MPLADLYNSTCTRCALSQRAHSICVPGRGAESGVRILIVGEAPGANEDQEGLPFVGPSGRLLEMLLSEAKVDKRNVRFENIVRCIPLKKKEINDVRPPEQEEISACLPYLQAVIRQLVAEGSRPVIVAAGNTALQALTGFAFITRNRGRFLPLKAGMEDLELTVMGIIHPAAVLRGNSSYRQLIVNDLALAWQHLDGQGEKKYWADYIWVDSLDFYRRWAQQTIERFQRGELRWIAFDTETTGFSPYDSKQRLVCFSFSTDPGTALVVPLSHKDSPWRNDPLAIKEIYEITARLLSIVPVCGWNLSFDFKWVWLKAGIALSVLYDGFLGSRWLYGSKRLAHDLNTLASQQLSFHGHGDEVKAEMAAIKQQSERHYGNLSKAALLRYAGGDADSALQLCEQDYQRMQDIVLGDGQTMLDKFNFMQMRALPRLTKMEMNGVKVLREINEYLKTEYVKTMKPLEDRVRLSSWGQQAARILTQRRAEMGIQTDEVANLKSVDYVRCLLFDAMGFTTEDTHVKGKALPKTGPPTGKEAIANLIDLCGRDERLFEQRDVMQALMEWKLLKHNYNNFINNAENYLFEDGIFHTQYNTAGTETGRVSTYQPSLHGIPKSSMVRWQFVSRWQNKGGLIVSADASQMELRVLAFLSGDENLAASFRSGIDLHKVNASKMFRVAVEQVTYALRQKAKIGGFATVYGATPGTIAAQSKSTVREAEEVIDSWYRAYPKTREYQDNEWLSAKKYGHTYTPFGRIRWIENIQGAKPGSHAWRQTINTKIQSTASDLVLVAIMETLDEIERRQMQSKLFGFIHDAAITDVYPGELWDILKIKKRFMESFLMESFPWITVPLVASFDICPGWGFPCEVKSFTDTEIELVGPAQHAALLQQEVSHLPGVTYEQTGVKVDKDTGKQEVTATLRRAV